MSNNELMNMKVIAKLFLVLAAAGAVISACAKKSDIDDLQKQIDALKSDQIQTISGQISSIQASLTNLQATDTELKNYISKLETQAATLENTSKTLEESIAKVKADLEKEIGTVESNALAQMEALKASVDDELKTIKSAIETLQAKDEDLQKQIDALKTYTDTQISGAKDWATATFATLEEYNKTAEIVADLQTRIEALKSEITADYTKALTDAIAKSEESMKNWINEQLTGYYTISEMDTMLELLEDELDEQKEDLTDLIDGNTEKLAGLIDENKKSISNLTDSLAAQKAAITTAYTKAIATAVEEQGKINKTVQDSLTSYNTRLLSLESKVATFEKDIASIKDDIATIKRDILILKDDIKRSLSKLTSITYIPECSDFTEHIEYTTDGLNAPTPPESIKLRFDVYPTDCADSIARAYAKFENKEIAESPLSARIVYTETRAEAGDFADLTILSATANNGVLTVTVSTSGLDNKFVLGQLEAALVLRVTTSVNCIQSDYIRLKAEGDGLSYYRCMIKNADKDGNGSISEEEINAIWSLDFRGFSDITSLDLTVFPSLTDVICPSLDWLVSLDLKYLNTTHFYTRGEGYVDTPLILDDEVLINKVIWKKKNVGATKEYDLGSEKKYEDAICPGGYRMPTIEEWKSLVDKHSWQNEGNYCGYWCSGEQEYSSSVPAVFIPAHAVSNRYYWSITPDRGTRYKSMGFKNGGSGIDSSSSEDETVSANQYVRCVRDLR